MTRRQGRRPDGLVDREVVAMAPGRTVKYRCSFCGKSQEQVHQLIAGPGGVHICDECIDLCRQVVTEEAPGDAEQAHGWRAKAGGLEWTESVDTVREVAVVVTRLVEGYEQRLRSIEQRLAALEQRP
jgi:hypothetical protein